MIVHFHHTTDVKEATLAEVKGLASDKELRKLQQQLSAIQRELQTIATFRKTEHIKRFRRQLIGEYSYVKQQITRIMSAAEKARPPSPTERRARQRKANRNRSAKMEREWRYFAAIQANYLPNKGKKEIRSIFSKRRKGMQVEVDDVVWRNPSP